MSENINKIVVAYSGGLDTSVLVTWLKDTYQAEIIAYCADVGQQEELDGLEEKALATGASACIIDDLKATFAADFIYPMIQAGAIYEGQYLLGTSIARPCISEGMVRVAREYGADAIAHGATGKGNDQVRFELSTASLAPDIEMIAPWRQQRFRDQFPGRAEMIEYAAEHNIPVQASAKKSYSMDRNLLHISFESGVLEDVWYDASGEADRDMYVLSVSPEEAPDQPEYVQLLFKEGNCVGLALEGLDEVLTDLGDVSKEGAEGEYTLLNPYGVMRVLNYLGGKHGIGRIDMVENRFVGLRSRGVYETPGGTVLHAAHRAVESITLDRDVMHERDRLSPRFAELIYNGFWFSPEMRAMRAMIDAAQQNVTGEARLKLYKGGIQVTGRRSPVSLYDAAASSFEFGGAADGYDQKDATGFIKLQGLRLRPKIG